MRPMTCGGVDPCVALLRIPIFRRLCDGPAAAGGK